MSKCSLVFWGCGLNHLNLIPGKGMSSGPILLFVSGYECKAVPVSRVSTLFSEDSMYKSVLESRTSRSTFLVLF